MAFSTLPFDFESPTGLLTGTVFTSPLRLTTPPLPLYHFTGSLHHSNWPLAGEKHTRLTQDQGHQGAAAEALEQDCDDHAKVVEVRRRRTHSQCNVGAEREDEGPE